MADPSKDSDRLIQQLYAMAFEMEWDAFRPQALEQVCRWLGASGAAWLTRSSTDLPGEYAEWPAGSGAGRDALARISMPMGVRELDLPELPAGLAPAGSAETGHALNYAHRGGALSSLVVLRFGTGRKPRDVTELRRVIGHMVEAGTLSLRQFVQRDEWLFLLGRTSRGSAAIVDERGTIYVASQRFRDLVAAEFGSGDINALPAGLPDDVLTEDEGTFISGELYFRASRRGNLFLLHARRPVPLDSLSPREQEIARALGNGKTFKSVARQFDIAVSTVANHASRIYKKLGIFRREELVELVRKPAGGAGRTTH